jgi:7-keto-8-aminopelargonate synthetase-like enzyme
MSIHRELEAKLARLKEAEDCMLFASGYQANLGWIEALVQRHDVLIYDQQSHASLIDGISMTRDLKRYRTMRFRHNSVQHLRSKLEKAREGLQGQIFVAVEGVYSMCGDLAPLPEIQSLCKEYGAFLVVDDAHGTGVMGKTGRGTSEHFLLKDQPDLTMGTLSKAFGAIGGFLCGSKAVIDYLRFFSRSYMFSAHLPPTVVAGVSAGVDLLVAEPERVQVLRDNVEYLLRGFQRIGLAVKSASAIIAIRIGKNIPIRPLTLAFHQAGIFLNCIEYPAVSKDNQCLRLSVMATHSKEQLDHVISSFSTIGKDWGFIKV